jgi:hypothetical protein
MFMNEEDYPKVPFIMEGISSRFIRENHIIPLDFKNNVLHLSWRARRIDGHECAPDGVASEICRL